MFAVYALHADKDDPLSALRLGEQPEPDVREGWVRVKLSHATLNRHDLFTLRGITSHREGIPFPIIMGNDGAGTLDDGTPVVIYPVMGSDDWRDDETLDPHWHIFSEFVPGTFADYVAVPKRNAIVLPEGLSALSRPKGCEESSGPATICRRRRLDPSARQPRRPNRRAGLSIAVPNKATYRGTGKDLSQLALACTRPSAEPRDEQAG